MKNLVKPSKLSKGDTIGIVTPSEPITEEKLSRYEKGIDELKVRGFRIKVGEYALGNKDNYVASSDSERAEDINRMFKDPEVKAILCTTGGYNSNGVLPHLDYQAIAKNPKIFVGLSDPTAIINAIHKKTGLVTFHGPSVMSDYGKGIQPYTEESFNLTVMNIDCIGDIKPFSEWEVLKDGKARGKLIGGNLSTLQLLIGTEYEPEWNGAILFWEDIGVEPHNLENKLLQFKQAGILDRIAGMIVGRCVDCEEKSYKRPLTIQQVVKKTCEEYSFPIIYNVDLGHTREKITIPIGLEALIDTSRLSLSILDSAVM